MAAVGLPPTGSWAKRPTLLGVPRRRLHAEKRVGDIANWPGRFDRNWAPYNPRSGTLAPVAPRLRGLCNLLTTMTQPPCKSAIY